MEKFFKIIGIIFVVLGLAVSATKVTPLFLPETSDLVIFADHMGSTGFVFTLVGLLLCYQMKIVELHRQLKDKNK